MKKSHSARLLAILLSVGCGTLLLSYTAPAQARERSERRAEWEIESRIRRAEARIDHNLDRRRLSRQEAYRLRRELGYIRADADRMLRDGHLDWRERERLDRELDNLNRQIDRDKRD